MVGSIYAAVAAWIILGNNGEGERILPGPKPSPIPPLAACRLLCAQFQFVWAFQVHAIIRQGSITFRVSWFATGWTWRSYVVVAAAPVFITLALVIGIMPESPRYLLAKQKYHEVAKMLSK